MAQPLADLRETSCVEAAVAPHCPCCCWGLQGVHGVQDTSPTLLKSLHLNAMYSTFAEQQAVCSRLKTQSHSTSSSPSPSIPLQTAHHHMKALAMNAHQHDEDRDRLDFMHTLCHVGLYCSSVGGRGSSVAAGGSLPPVAVSIASVHSTSQPLSC
jgi:hypothetical protein